MNERARWQSTVLNPYVLSVTGTVFGITPGGLLSTWSVVEISHHPHTLANLHYLPIEAVALLLIFLGGPVGCWWVLAAAKATRPWWTGLLVFPAGLVLTGAALSVAYSDGQRIADPTNLAEFVLVASVAAVVARWTVHRLLPAGISSGHRP